MARVLLVAPTCDSEDVGEAWVAHQWATRLALDHEVTLLTYHKRGRTPASEQLSGVEVVEWREPPLVGRFERLNSLLKPGYVPFYLRARRWIRAALAEGRVFDVVHQPVPVAMRYPCPAAGLGIPVVVGPVGGGLGDPPGFGEDDTAPWFVRLRTLDRVRLLRDPLLRRTYTDAACVVGIADYVRENLAGVPVRRFEVMSETGLTTLPGLTPRPDPRPAAPYRLLFVGRLVRTKAARDVIAALALLPELDVVLDVVGDGPDRAACERLVAETGQAARVSFHGAVPRAAVDDFYRRADVFVFPSYREPGGNVVFEAMGHGLPLVVSDRGGPASAVDDSCGIRVPVVSAESFAPAIAEALSCLLNDPDRMRRMGLAARERAADIGLWGSRVRDMEAIYASLH